MDDNPLCFSLDPASSPSTNLPHHQGVLSPNSQPHLLPILRDGLHQTVGFRLQGKQLFVNLGHPLVEIHAVILGGRYPHISAGVRE